MLFRTVQPFSLRNARYSWLVHLLWRGKPASFMKNALILPENEFSAWVKVGATNTPSSFSTRRISERAFSGSGTMCSALETIITSKLLSA